MCGIAGIIDKKKSDSSDKLKKKFLKKLATGDQMKLE